MASAPLQAEEKTPPFYSGEEPRVTASAPASETQDPAGDFSELFPRTTATRGPSMDQEGFQTEEYVVKEGDWLVKILREKGLANEQNLPELLSLLRKLNSSLHDLNMIQPGEKIVILVKVVPGNEPFEKTPSQQNLAHDTYRVQRGDILSRVAMERYPLSRQTFNREYLKMFAACNPSVQNPDHLLVGQVINLPHYPPSPAGEQKALPVLRDLGKTPNRLTLSPRIPIEPAPPAEPTPPPKAKRPSPMPQPVQPEPVPSEAAPAPDPWLHLKPVLPEEPPVSRPTNPPTAPASVEPQSAPAAAEKTSPPPGPWPTHVRPVSPGEGFDRVGSGEATAVRTNLILTDGLGTVISRMGDEWIDSGEHVIPMLSGGHIQLDAASYPMVRFREGITLIVDLNNTLPQKMGRVIESTWANYRVIRLSASDDLRSALDKILKTLNYPSAVAKGQPLTLAGPVPVSISGDWIVKPPRSAGGNQPEFLVINLMDAGGRGLPVPIKTYLKGIGVEVIEYPATDPDGREPAPPEARSANDPAALVQAILEMRGIPFRTHVNIPAYETANEDFKFTVRADVYLEIRGRRYVIDVGGLNPTVVGLLKENGTSVLSVGGETGPVEMASSVLNFLDVPFERGPHPVAAPTGNGSSHVTVSLDGITFFDQKGAAVLATPIDLPAEIVAFLNQKGYSVLVLSPFAPSAPQKTNSHTESQRKPKNGVSSQ